MKKTFKYWLRWVVVLPAALAASIIALFPLHLILYFTLRNWVEPVPELPERLLTPFVVAIVFIWVGTYTAPELKKQTSIVLFSILLFFSGGLIFLTLSDGTWFGNKLYFQAGGIPPVMFIIGAFVGLYISNKNGSLQKEYVDET
jgi:hypothetical protein